MTVLVAWLLASGFAEPEVNPPAFFAGNSEIHAYLIEAAENNPELRMRYNAWQAALNRVPQARSLGDPMFTFGQFLQSDVNRMKFALSQKFPSFGTRKARGDKAAAEAEAALHRFYATRDRIVADVKHAYFQYGFLGESIRVTEAQIEILRFTEEIVRSKYSLGLASEDELLRVEIEAARVQDRLESFKQTRPSMAAGLNRALGRPAQGEIPWPNASELPPPLPPRAEVFAKIAAENPELSVLDLLAERSELDVALARKEGHPDFTVGIDYTSVSRPRKIRPDRPFPSSLHGARRLLSGTSAGPGGALTDLYAVGFADEPISYRSGGDDNVLVTVQVNLPIWRKRLRAGVEEAKLLGKAVEDERDAKALALQSAASRAMFDMQDATRRYALYEQTLLPKARQSYQSLQSAYAAGDTKASFLDLLDSVRLLLDFELEQIRSNRDLQLAAAELERLTGGPWPASN